MDTWKVYCLFIFSSLIFTFFTFGLGISAGRYITKKEYRLIPTTKRLLLERRLRIDWLEMELNRVTKQMESCQDNLENIEEKTFKDFKSWLNTKG